VRPPSDFVEESIVRARDVGHDFCGHNPGRNRTALALGITGLMRYQ
jgi:hypothetical protein